jgi:hypothetical protein
VRRGGALGSATTSSGPACRIGLGRLVPKAAVSNRSRAAPLFDHPVGAGEQRRRDVEAERLGGLEVDDQLQLGGELNRQIARRNAVQDLVHVIAAAAEAVTEVDAIADQPAVIDMLAISVDGRQPRRRGERRTPTQDPSSA